MLPTMQLTDAEENDVKGHGPVWGDFSLQMPGEAVIRTE
jgi:hypothetical protein